MTVLVVYLAVSMVIQMAEPSTWHPHCEPRWYLSVYFSDAFTETSPFHCKHYSEYILLKSQQIVTSSSLNCESIKCASVYRYVHGHVCSISL